MTGVPAAGAPSAGERAAGGAPEVVRGEAARTVRRLEEALRRLEAARAPQPPSPQPPSPQPSSPQPRVSGAPAPDISRADAPGARGSGVRRIDGDDDELRDLLDPAIDRVARVIELARALADGRLSEESADEAARAVAAGQPFRRPR